MMWQQAKKEAIQMAETITADHYTVVIFDSDEAYKSAHPLARWTREEHKIVMQALYRVLDRKGVKVMRVRGG